jgi:hypothetical protein
MGRRGIEVAAAGGHHIALFGPPGAGKTMLAERLPSVLPELDDDAALEVTALQSIAGVLPDDGRLVRRPPFQAPHHSASLAALVGGGSGLARPGALSLAHRGVLFLDEAPELATATLQALRQPLESGRVVLARARGTTVYPARVQLVLAANPCPCASPAGDQACQCSPVQRRRYLGRISGPLLDRIDIQIKLKALSAAQLMIRHHAGRAVRGRGRTGGQGPGGGRGTLVGRRLADQRGGARPASAPAAVAAAAGRHGGAAERPRPRDVVGSRIRPRGCVWRGPLPTWTAVIGPTTRTSTRRLSCGWERRMDADDDRLARIALTSLAEPGNRRGLGHGGVCRRTGHP